MTISRRHFVWSLPAAVALVTAARPRAPRLAPPAPLRIGFVAASGDASRSAALGAAMGADEAARAATLFGGGRVELVRGDDAGALVRDGVQALVGGHDPSAGSRQVDAECARLSALADDAGILFLNVGCASDALRGAGCRRHTFHVAASEAMRRDALDGGAGTVELWHHSLEAFGAAQLNDRHRAAHGVAMDSAAWAGWFAVKVLAEAALRSRDSSPAALLARLERPDARFDGHKGVPLSFRRWDHQLRQPLYVMRADEVVQVPPRSGGGATAAERLDVLGTRAAESACRWPR